jgi:hypothetical protein
MSLPKYFDNEILFESIDSGLGDRVLSIIGFIVLCETINATPVINFNNINTCCEWGSNEYDINNFVFEFNTIIYNETKQYYRKVSNQTSFVLSPLKLYKIF